MKVNKIVLVMVLGAASVLAGCTTQAQRLAECEAKGISKDTCYLAEQNKQAALNATYEKQAMENAANAVQHAQSAREMTKHFAGMTIKVASGGMTVDGKPAAVLEKAEKATVYQQGLYNFIVYHTGKVAVTENGVFKGYAK